MWATLRPSVRLFYSQAGQTAVLSRQRRVQTLLLLIAVPVGLVGSLTDAACLVILAAMLDAFAFTALWKLAHA